MIHAQLTTENDRIVLTCIKQDNTQGRYWSVTSRHSSRLEAVAEAEKIGKWQGEIVVFDEQKTAETVRFPVLKING